MFSSDQSKAHERSAERRQGVARRLFVVESNVDATKASLLAETPDLFTAPVAEVPVQPHAEHNVTPIGGRAIDHAVRHEQRELTERERDIEAALQAVAEAHSDRLAA